MSYEFKKLSEVEALTDVPEGAKVLAEANGQIVRVPGSGLGGGVQPDWSQNDETKPDYVKNRTHWATVSVETLVPKTTVYGKGETAPYPCIPKLAFFDIQPNDVYTIIWDDIAYNVVAGKDDRDEFLGNMGIAGGPDTSEPFFIAEDGTEIVCFTNTSGTHSIEIIGTKREYHTLDKNYVYSESLKNQIIKDMVGKDESIECRVGKLKASELQSKYGASRRLWLPGTWFGSYPVTEYYSSQIRIEDVFEYTAHAYSDFRMCFVDVIFKFEAGGTGDELCTSITIKYPKAMRLQSTTSGSTKVFEITVDDSGALTATEVTT